MAYGTHVKHVVKKTWVYMLALTLFYMCGFPLFKCSFPTVGFYMFFLGMFGSPWFKQTAQLVDVLHFSGPNKNWRPRMSSSRCATVMAAASRKPFTASLVMWSVEVRPRRTASTR